MTSSGGAKRGALLVGIAGAVIALDQLAKSWAVQSLAAGVPRHVLGPTYLLLTYNKGAAFSLGSGASSLIEALAVALAVAVMWLSGRLAKGGTNLAAITGFGLVSGGALSNLADRFVRHHHGAVVDFIQLVSWWPIFNVADAAITVGAVTIAVTLVLFSAPARTAPARTGPSKGLTNSKGLTKSLRLGDRPSHLGDRLDDRAPHGEPVDGTL
jgi:signal peptidase II